MFRSEEMGLYRLLTLLESAYEYINALDADENNSPQFSR